RAHRLRSGIRSRPRWRRGGDAAHLPLPLQWLPSLDPWRSGMAVERRFAGLVLASLFAVAPAWAGDDEVAAHRERIQRWQAERDAALRKPDGWLSFTGSGTVP